MTEQDKDTFPSFETTMIDMACEDGIKTVPGRIHESAPGLAVAMFAFGMFNITHIKSGKKISQNMYERADSAMCELASWALIANTYGFDFTLEAPDLKAFLSEHGSKPVPFEGATTTANGETLPMTIENWIQSTTWGFIDEFPWEDSHPLDDAVDILKKIGSEES